MNLILFLLLALTASRTGLVQCEDNSEDELVVATIKTSEEGEGDPVNPGDVEGSGDGGNQGSGNHPLLKSYAIASTLDLGSTPNSESVNEENESPTDLGKAGTEESVDLIMIIIPLVLTLVIIAVVVCVVVIYRRGRTRDADRKEDPYLDHEDHEKVPMPMFDDDIPSVMELEMEDLENWISKDGGKKVDTGQI